MVRRPGLASLPGGRPGGVLRVGLATQAAGAGLAGACGVSRGPGPGAGSRSLLRRGSPPRRPGHGSPGRAGPKGTRKAQVRVELTTRCSERIEGCSGRACSRRGARAGPTRGPAAARDGACAQWLARSESESGSRRGTRSDSYELRLLASSGPPVTQACQDQSLGPAAAAQCRWPRRRPAPSVPRIMIASDGPGPLRPWIPGLRVPVPVRVTVRRVGLVRRRRRQLPEAGSELSGHRVWQRRPGAGDEESTRGKSTHRARPTPGPARSQ